MSGLAIELDEENGMGDKNEATKSGPRQKVKLNDTTRIVVQSNDLRFTVSRYNDLKSYSWFRFYRHKDYGEIGGGIYCLSSLSRKV